MNFFASRFGKQEATACDADIPPMPINGNSNNSAHTLLNVPTGSGKAAAKGVSQSSLEKHDQRFHHGHYDGGKCKYREQNGIKQGTPSTRQGGGGGGGKKNPPVNFPFKSRERKNGVIKKGGFRV